uniref:Uncharacterized protein n=1 Tax=Clastoptera arizonana TaxID=38151 RepID=A0A1B6DEH0_9HEMI
MNQIPVLIIAAILSVCTGDETCKSSKIPTLDNTSLANLTGQPLYLRYHRIRKLGDEIDGVAYNVQKNAEENTYKVDLQMIHIDGSPRVENFYWIDVPEKHEMKFNDSEYVAAYSFPYINKDQGITLLYTCADYKTGKIESFQVLSTGRYNDVSEAVKVANKISQGVTQLPFARKSEWDQYSSIKIYNSEA